MNKELLEYSLNFNRRRFLSKMSLGIGSVALGSLLIPDLFGEKNPEEMLLAGLPHFAPKAKRIIYLFQKLKMFPLTSITYGLTRKFN